MTLNRGAVQGQGPVRGVVVLMLTDVKRILVWCSESVNSGLLQKLGPGRGRRSALLKDRNQVEEWCR